MNLSLFWSEGARLLLVCLGFPGGVHHLTVCCAHCHLPVLTSLEKNAEDRADYEELLSHPFAKRCEADTSLEDWLRSVEAIPIED